jgi:hypothetical protein
LESGFSNICKAFQAREENFENLKEIIEDNENDQFGFIYQTDEAFKIIQQELEMNRGENRDNRPIHRPRSEVNSSFQNKKFNSTDSSGNSFEPYTKQNMDKDSADAMMTASSIRIQDLQRTNDLLLKELRKANDKYFGERLETKKVKEELDKLVAENKKLKNMSR